MLETHSTGLTLYQMADTLKVTPRTMRRYMKEVERLYELEPTRVKGGGQQIWRIPARELPRKVDLRRTQAYALVAARRLFASLKGTALYAELDVAVTRLIAVAQRPGRGPNAGLANARLEERFLYLPVAPKDYQTKLGEFDDVFQAVADLRPMTMLYRSIGGTTETRVHIHPYALVMHKDSIYCVAMQVDKQAMRTFLLDRMRDTQVETTGRFELPSDFSVDDYFQGEFGIWRSDERHRVVIDFDAAGAEYVKLRRVHTSQKLTAIAGGGVRLSMTIGSLTPLVSWVLEWGERARVIEPPELAERVVSELRRALARYGSPELSPKASAAKPSSAKPSKPRSSPVEKPSRKAAAGKQPGRTPAKR